MATRTIRMLITVEVVDEGTAWNDALFHYEQQGRGDMEANAYMPGGQELDLPHAVLEACLAWMAATDLKLVKTEVSELAPDEHADEEELTHQPEREEEQPSLAGSALSIRMLEAVGGAEKINWLWASLSDLEVLAGVTLSLLCENMSLSSRETEWDVAARAFASMATDDEIVGECDGNAQPLIDWLGGDRTGEQVITLLASIAEQQPPTVEVAFRLLEATVASRERPE